MREHYPYLVANADRDMGYLHHRFALLDCSVVQLSDASAKTQNAFPREV